MAMLAELPEPVVKQIVDVLLLRLLVDRGGQMVMTWDELLGVGKEFDGYRVRLSATKETLRLTVEGGEEL